MDSKADLENWRALWQGEPDEGPSSAAVVERTMRETRRRRLRLLAPIVATAGIGGWAAMRAIVSGTTDDVVLAVEAWLFIAVMWTGSLWIDRGTWQPLGDSTSAFLDLAIHRCRSAIKAARFGVVMYFVQLAAVMGWKGYYLAIDPVTLLRSSPGFLLGWIGVPLLVVLSIWHRRKKTAELQQLIRLREELRRE